MSSNNEENRPTNYDARGIAALLKRRKELVHETKSVDKELALKKFKFDADDEKGIKKINACYTDFINFLLIDVSTFQRVDDGGIATLSIDLSPAPMSAETFLSAKKTLDKRIEFFEERVEYFDDYEKQQEVKTETLRTALSGHASSMLDVEERLEKSEAEKKAVLPTLKDLFKKLESLGKMEIDNI